jgi:trk system potassium uptake protein
MLAVVALVGRLAMLFALLMVVPLAFAWGGRDGAEGAFAAAPSSRSVPGPC